MLAHDASPTGLSAILLQNTSLSDSRRDIACNSQTFTPVERQYPQTEREALAIVWAIENLHIYVYGSQFKVITDCKPVQLTFGNLKSKPPERSECWNLRFQGCDFEAVHTQGSYNPSDNLSRHAVHQEERPRSLAEEYVCFLATNAVPKVVTLDKIELATKQNKTLQCMSWLV